MTSEQMEWQPACIVSPELLWGLAFLAVLMSLIFGIGWYQNRKQRAKAQVDNAHIRMLRAWRPIGTAFQYLGRTCAVVSHWRYGGNLGGDMGWDCWVDVGIEARYVDEMGQIHPIRFGLAESVLLMGSQIEVEPKPKVAKGRK